MQRNLSVLLFFSVVISGLILFIKDYYRAKKNNWTRVGSLNSFGSDSGDGDYDVSDWGDFDSGGSGGDDGGGGGGDW